MAFIPVPLDDTPLFQGVSGSSALMPWNSVLGTEPTKFPAWITCLMLCIGQFCRSPWRLSSVTGGIWICLWAALCPSCAATSVPCQKIHRLLTGGTCGQLLVRLTGMKCFMQRVSLVFPDFAYSMLGHWYRHSVCSHMEAMD